MIYRVSTSGGTYWWGDNQGNWQANFNSQFPNVRITGATPIDVSAAPSQYQGILRQFNAPTSTPAPAAAPAPAPAPAAPAAPVKTAAQVIQEALEKQIVEWTDKSKTYDAAHPFAFDEALASDAAKQQNDPYYQQKLSDFLQGITTQRTRSTQDEQTVLSDLKATTDSFTGKTQEQLNRALNASAEGFADSGLFFSGQRIAQEGRLTNDSNQTMSDFMQGQNQKSQAATTTASRALEDLTTKQTQGTRDLNTNEQADIQKDINTARGQAFTKYEIARNQFLGPAPGETPASYDASNTSLLKSLYA